MRRETFGSRAAACAALGLGPDATLDDARRAYRQLARTQHPDAGGDAAEFERTAAAWDFLERHPNPGDEPRAAGSTSSSSGGRPAAAGASLPDFENRPAPAPPLTAFGAGCFGVTGVAIVFGVLALIAVLAAGGGSDEPTFRAPSLALPEQAVLRSSFVAAGTDPRPESSPARAYLVADPAGLSDASVVAAAEASGWSLRRVEGDDLWFTHAGSSPLGHPAYVGDLDRYLATPGWYILDGSAPDQLGRFEGQDLLLVQVFAPVSADPAP